MSKTKDTISNTLLKLLEKNAFDDITISTIIDESHISRSTFYRHFKHKEDVLTYLYYQRFDSLFFDKNTRLSYYQLASQSIQYANQHRKLLLNMIYDKNNTLIKLMYHRNMQYFSKWTDKMTVEQHDLLGIYLRGTFITSISWFRNNNIKSDKEMIYIFKQAMPESLQTIFNEKNMRIL